jgi:hypothetical protein
MLLAVEWLLRRVNDRLNTNVGYTGLSYTEASS